MKSGLNKLAFGIKILLNTDKILSSSVPQGKWTLILKPYPLPLPSLLGRPVPGYAYLS